MTAAERPVPTAAELLRIWLDDDQPCRAWCMAQSIGRPPCYDKTTGHLDPDGCWFAQAALAATEGEA